MGKGETGRDDSDRKYLTRRDVEAVRSSHNA
jgi:hypothetical protein